MDKELLENILKHAEKENAVQSVLSFEGKFPASSYIHYKSSYSKLPMTVVLGSGKSVKRSLILKEPVIEDDGVNDNFSFFKNETMIYVSVLKEVDNIMKEFEDTNDVVWCKLFHHENYKALFFEDLEAKGFKFLKWNTMLDADHSILALRNLGRFHGMCKVLEEKGVIVKQNYATSCHFFSNKNFVDGFFRKGFQILQKGILKYWGMSWDSVAEKLSVHAELIEKKLAEIGEVSDTRFNVLNHGDFWVNNIMFKYDLDSRPYTMRLLNFQRPFYNTPCLDITFFMYLSIDPFVRRSDFDKLLRAYYDSLVFTLDKFGFNGAKPKYDDIFNDMDRVSFFGLSVFAILHAVLTANKINPSDIELLYTTEGKDISREIYKDTSLISRMSPDLVTFIQTAGL